MAAMLLRCRSCLPLLRAYGRLGTTSRTRALKRYPPCALSLTAPYSTPPVGRGFGMVGRFVKRQVYLVLLVGGVSAGALLLVSGCTIFILLERGLVLKACITATWFQFDLGEGRGIYSPSNHHPTALSPNTLPMSTLCTIFLTDMRSACTCRNMYMYVHMFMAFFSLRDVCSFSCVSPLAGVCGHEA